MYEYCTIIKLKLFIDKLNLLAKIQFKLNNQNTAHFLKLSKFNIIGDIPFYIYMFNNAIIFGIICRGRYNDVSEWCVKSYILCSMIQ